MTILDIQIDVDGAPSMHGYLRAPEGGGRVPAIVVAHELFGVNPDVRGVVDHLSELGYVALAPEFHHRRAPGGSWLERNEDGRKRGFELLNHLTRDDVVQDVRAAMTYLAAREDTSGPVGMLGFSMGGHIAYLAATRLDIVATAVLYGGWLTGTEVPLSRPEPTLALTPGIAAHRGKVLYIVGGKDSLIDARQVEAIESALSRAGVPHEVVVYPEAQHAFFWEGTPAFHAPSRGDAWKRVGDFFAAAFRA